MKARPRGAVSMAGLEARPKALLLSKGLKQMRVYPERYEITFTRNYRKLKKPPPSEMSGV
jgi:hypothetical protein